MSSCHFVRCNPATKHMYVYRMTVVGKRSGRLLATSAKQKGAVNTFGNTSKTLSSFLFLDMLRRLVRLPSSGRTNSRFLAKRVPNTSKSTDPRVKDRSLAIGDMSSPRNYIKRKHASQRG